MLSSEPEPLTPSAKEPQASVGCNSCRKRTLALGAALALFGIMCVMAFVSGGIVSDTVYGPDDLRNGPRSQIIEWESGNTAVQISRLSALPADHLWKVVTDQNRFDEFMPYVRKSTVEANPDGTILEKQILDLPAGSYDLELIITLSEEGNARKAAWKQKKGALNYNAGAWVVETHGNESVLRYQVAAQWGLLPQWMTNSAMRGRLGKLLEAVENRTQSLQQKEPQYFSETTGSVTQ